MGLTLNISPSSYTGFAKGTVFSFYTDVTSTTAFDAFLWNFGDGNYSRNPITTHVYEFPGTYNVSLNFYKNDGTVLTESAQVNVSFYLNESIIFEKIPPPTFAGHLNRYPFKINITSSSTDEHYIDLGAQFSKSYQYQEPENKWSFLRPQWRFLDLNGNQINSIKTKDTPIKIDQNGNISNSGLVVGVTGTAEFYFVDDFYNTDYYYNNTPYTVLIATLQTSGLKVFSDSLNTDSKTPGYANSLATITIPHIFTWREPDYLSISQNGVDGFNTGKIRFTNQINPFLVALKYNKNYIFDDVQDVNGVTVASLYEFANYFPDNNSQTIPISLSANRLSTGPQLTFNYIPSAIQFSFNDNNGFKTGGYFKGLFTCATSAIDAYIDGSVNVSLPFLYAKYTTPILWISNPQAGMMATTFYFNNTSLSAITNGYMDKYHVTYFDMPIKESTSSLTFFETNVNAVSGFHGINSIAALPSPTYHAWVADSELDKLYRINARGDILIEISLINIVNDNIDGLIDPRLKLSPAQVVVDSQQNVWVTLYDVPYILKFDSIGNYLGNIFIPENAVTSPQYNKTSNIDPNDPDVNLVEPTGIETDIDDNVWVTFSNPLCSLVIKYDGQTLEELNRIQYPEETRPQEIICDGLNNLWIVKRGNTGGSRGYLEKRDTYGNVLSSFGPFNNPNHITLDLNQNLWVTYGYNWVAKIDISDGQISTLQILGGDYSDRVPEWFDANVNADETSLEGITCDQKNRIFVINSIENKIFVIDANNVQIIDSFYINPKGFTFSLSAAQTPTQIGFDPWSKSAQAFGDWSGFRWINKYASKYYINSGYQKINNVFTKQITGTSDKFSFYSNDTYDLFKVNENFNLAQYMNNMTFQPLIKENENFYENFLGSIWGQKVETHEDIGVKSYEKISNFVNNQSDVDLCNVNALYSLAQQIGLNTDDFRINYPIAIQRLMDLLSINQSRLIGTILSDEQNFDKSSQYYNFNRGNILDPDTYVVNAGTPVILKTKALGKYKLIKTGPIDPTGESSLNKPSENVTSTYSLNDLANFLQLSNPWTNFYEFYEFLPSNNLIYSENVIDWDSEKLSFNRDALLAFLKNQIGGSVPDQYLKWDSDQGLMEFLFTYEIYKGLGLI